MIEYRDRVKARVQEAYNLKFNSFRNAKELGDFKEIQGYMRACEDFDVILQDQINPPKKEENNVESSQYEA